MTQGIGSDSLDPAETTTDQLIRRGVTWSALATLALRIGNLVVGIILARLITPDVFGVFAVALSVQVIFLSASDVGMEAYLVRSLPSAQRTRTVATLSVIAGAALTAIVAASSGTLARAFGMPEATPVIAALSVSLLVASIGIVPHSRLIREFDQRKIFVITVTNFAVQAAVTISLVLLGYGPMALAVALLAAQATGAILAFVLTRTWPSFGFVGVEVGPALRFGIPAALAGLISLALVNVDNLVIARLLGDVQLGYYVIAFSLANWPMSAIGYALQPVALAAFARAAHTPGRNRDTSLAIWISFSWAVALPIALVLVVLAAPIVRLLYGAEWLPAAAAVSTLGVFGAVRVLLDLLDKYLLARGESTTVLGIHLLWIGSLVPALTFGVSKLGIAGAGLAALSVAVVVILPAYVLAVRRYEADLAPILQSLWPPVLACVPAGLAAWGVGRILTIDVLTVILGALVGVAVYVGLMYRTLTRLRRFATDDAIESANLPLT